MKHLTLEDVGEIEALRGLIAGLPRGRNLRVGPGDDAAVVLSPSEGRDLLLTSDPVIEGVHFNPETPAAAVGHKAVGRVLSDIAAMGGVPFWCLLNVVAPSSTPLQRLRDLYQGAIRLARREQVGLVGGDLSAGPVLEVHAFAVGGVPRGRACLRSGARPGDWLFVTGSLGGSCQGYHLRFRPRLREGQWLRAGRWVSAMIDVSDGLASDLRHLLAASGVGAEVDLDAIPLSRAARQLQDGRGALDHALHDGEDFELLFTVPASRRRAFSRAWKLSFRLRCTCIGRIIEEADRIEWTGHPTGAGDLDAGGYEHFRGSAAR